MEDAENESFASGVCKCEWCPAFRMFGQQSGGNVYNTGISILARFIFGEFPKITSSKSLKVKEGIGSFDCF